ncbi:MAG TPA: Rne/Rng family ribonuclease [Thermoanaerobaculia bacterium]|nr:Rne/Rng family ribonuclease [Thermoanaerobaculia bacterium]
MLINARHTDELRIALVDGTRLESFQIEVAERGLSRGNIYRGTIANLQPALNAAFIDYGAERNGFLAIQDVVPEAYYREPDKKSRPRIDEVLAKGMPIVAQVEKEAEGQKGAVLTTNLSLAGRHLVFTPFDSTRGVSRKVEDEETRARLRQAARGLEVPAGSGLIVRTNALGENKATLARDLASLLRLWKQIEGAALGATGIELLYSDQDLLLRALRDHLDSSVEEVLVDDEEAFAKAASYMRALMPRSKIRLERYAERTPLFARYGLDRQIDAIYERSVPLPGGGSLVIDRAEALTAIDVNSGRSVKSSTQEETALHTNLEAAQETARQLRLRDIGGLVVVDFIDMRSQKARRRVEKELREAMKIDRARSSVGRISENGLLEINRQRIQQALHLRTHVPCAACGGTGRVPSPEMATLGLLRRIEARAALGDLESARVTLHPDVAEAFRRGRRDEIETLERDFGIQVSVAPSSRLQRSEHEFEWGKREGAVAALPPPPEEAAEAVEIAADAAPAAEPEAPTESQGAASSQARRRRGRRGGRGRRRR